MYGLVGHFEESEIGYNSVVNQKQTETGSFELICGGVESEIG